MSVCPATLAICTMRTVDVDDPVVPIIAAWKEGRFTVIVKTS
jgi:hypothetical protein